MSNTNDNSNPDQTGEQLIEAPVEFGSQLPTFSELLPEQALPYWQFVKQYPIIEAIVIFCCFWLLAYLVRRYVIRIVEILSLKTKSDLDDRVIDELRGPIYSTVLWIGVAIACQSAGFTNGLAKYITPLALSMIVLGLTRALLTVCGTVIAALSRDKQNFKKFDVRTEPLFIITARILLLTICAYFVLVIWGVNPVGLLASAGIVGIAIGFAAKDTLANLFSGIFILADRPYKLGDYVNLDTGERGMVTHIGIRSTRLLTRDDIEITIPNGVIGNAKVINESGGSHQKMRIRLSVLCAYNADLDTVNQVLMEIADNEPDICKFPSPRVRIRGFGESGINVQLMGWIEEPEDRGRVSHVMYMAIHRAFKENNLEIPYPKRDIRIESQE